MAAGLIGVKQRRAFSALLLRQALLQGRDDVDHVAAGGLRRCLALLARGFVFDQLFHVFSVSVVIFSRIEFSRHALDQLQGKMGGR
jgi:hypothetical protein